MKQLNKVLIGLTLIFFSSCGDILNQMPEVVVTSKNVWSSEYDAQKVFNAMNNEVRNGAKTAQYWLMGEVRAREFSICTDYVRQNIYYNTLYLSTGQGDFNWAPYYKCIALSNLLIENLKTVPIEQERKNYLLASSYFVRAFNYFVILRNWREAPLILTSDELNQGRKATALQLFDQIIADTKNAELLMAGHSWNEAIALSGIGIASKQMVSAGTIDALLAHVYAWHGSLTKNQDILKESVKYASKVIANSEYILATTPEEVCTKVMYGNSGEGIYEADFTTSETMGMAIPAYYLIGYPVVKNALPGGIRLWPYASYQLNNPFVEAVFDEVGDQRKTSYFYKFDEMKSTYGPTNGNRPYFQKWRTPIYTNDGNKTYTGMDANFIFFRLSDIYLLRAEIENRLGNAESARLDLNIIRQRAGLNQYMASVNGDLKLAILKERRRELFMEGQRFYDLIRNDELRNQVSTFKDMSETDVREGCYYLPVNAAAFTKNPAMRQNIYWKRNGY